MQKFQYYLDKFQENKALDSNDSYAIFSLIADNKIADAKIKEFLTSINDFGISEDLLFGAAKALNERSIKLKAPANAIDVCGTGGDNSNSLNISTTVAIILASMGVTVAKHGNKAVSSKSGSADIFSEIGIDLTLGKEEVEKSLVEKNLAFIFAPLYHPALKNVAKARKELGVRTIFNFLGPLLNPAQVKYQLIGCGSHKIAKIMIRVCQRLGLEKCMIVTGFDGMDEISISYNSIINRFDHKNGEITERFINPQDFDLDKHDVKLIEGQDPKYNAKMLIKLLKGDICDEKLQAYFDIVCLNTAAALIIANKAQNFDEGLKMAQDHIKSGKGFEFLEGLRK